MALLIPIGVSSMITLPEFSDDSKGWPQTKPFNYQEHIADAVSPWIPLSWITSRNRSVEEFKSAHRDSEKWLQSHRDKLEALLQMVSEGDEFATFMSPSATWENLRGRGGWAVIRNGVVIGQIVEIMS